MLLPCGCSAPPYNLDCRSTAGSWNTGQNIRRNTSLFVDDGYSVITFDRADWNRLMALVDDGKFGTIIVKDMSCLGRNYLKVGIYTEINFPNADIRFTTINNGIYSDNQAENAMTPFINIFNEFYAKDTSRRIRAVFKAGKPLCTNSPGG